PNGGVGRSGDRSAAIQAPQIDAFRFQTQRRPIRSIAERLPAGRPRVRRKGDEGVEWEILEPTVPIQTAEVAASRQLADPILVVIRRVPIHPSLDAARVISGLEESMARFPS